MSSIDPRSYVSVEQILAILDYMRDNPQLAHSRFSRTKEGRVLWQRHWAICADMANHVSSDCIQKTPEQWRSYYSAYKSKLKRKIKDIKAEMLASGGGPTRKRLSEVENRLFSILGPDLGDQYPVCNSPVSRLEAEHQPSSSTAEFLIQEDTNLTIGSDSSEIELYYPEDNPGHLGASPVKTAQLTADSMVHYDQPVDYTGQKLEPLVHTSQQSDTVEYTNQRLELVSHTRQQINPVAHSNKKLEHVAYPDQQVDPLVNTKQPRELGGHISQELDPVAHANPELEPVIYAGQQLDQLNPVACTKQELEHMAVTSQQPFFYTDQQLEPASHPERQTEPVVHRGVIKKDTLEMSPRRPRRKLNSDLDNDPVPIREATEALLIMERMKTEAKREATAAIHRLAGALESIADRIGELIPVTSPKPPKVEKVYKDLQFGK